MRLEDIEQVHAIDVASFKLPWSLRSFRFELTENPNAMLWVAELTSPTGNQIIGMIALWIIVDEAHIGTIAVQPDYRRQGVGRDLLVEALLGAYARGASQATLEVRQGNLPAQNMYKQFGFCMVGTRRRYYHDNGEDALLMTLQPLDPDKIQARISTDLCE